MSKQSLNKKNYKLRANLPLFLKGFALMGIVLTVLMIGIGFYLNTGNDEFRLKPGDTQLSEEVIGVVNGYQRNETDDGLKKYFIKADKATTFSDEHQELEKVYLEVFDENDQSLSDKITANKAIYIPAKDGTKDFRIYFAGDVDVKTRYSLNIQTDQIAYDKSTEVADSQEIVNFQRENISGSSLGAIVNIENKTLDLLKNVDINAYASDNDNEVTLREIKQARLKAGRAFVEQEKEKIKLEEGVEIYLLPKDKNDNELNQPTDIQADKAIAFFKDRKIKKIDLVGNVNVYQKPTDANKSWTKTKAESAEAIIDEQLESLTLSQNVQIETTANDNKPTRIRTREAKYFASDNRFVLEDNVEIITVENGNQTKILASRATYERDIEKFDLENNVSITTVQDSKPTKITASKAIYERSFGKVFLSGNAQVSQGGELIRGKVINAELYSNNKLKYAYASGDTFLRQENSERKTEVTANELNASFSKDQKIDKANALGNSEVIVTPANQSEYTKFAMSAPQAINLDFRNDGTLSDLQTQGRTTIKLNSPNNSPDATNKKLTADKINTYFRNNGNELSKATAIGNAELIIEPLRNSSQNYKSIVESPRFECEFFEKNNAKYCTANKRATVVRYPTIKGNNKQNLSANKLTATFDKNTQGLNRFDALGKAKFSEGDRNGLADEINFTAKNGLVRLQGDEPTVWNSEARAKADEIIWDTKSEKSSLKGKVSTTYYSQKKTGGATPFGDVSSPVFVTSANANFDHQKETGLYTGNARVWQGNNYIRADRLLIEQKEGQLFAEGKVQSMIYDANRTIAGRKSKTPVYASADKMFYRQKINLIRYENNVDIRQGTDRIVAGVANVYLDNTNQLKQTVVENNVIITQPNRRATGTFAQYNASDESVILRGNPARVVDAENGSSSGREVLVYLKENKVVGNGKSNPNGTGRIRTVYKIKDRKIN